MKTAIIWLLNLLFKREEINGANRCPTYLYRWTILHLKWSGIGIYIHHFVGEDWSRDLHDHPKRFMSIGLAGGYVEHTPKGQREYQAPWIRSFPASHAHQRRGRLRDVQEGILMLTKITIDVDADDERAIRMAMAKLQASPMFRLPEGDSCTAGGLLGEICRSWLDGRGEWPQEGDIEQ